MRVTAVILTAFYCFFNCTAGCTGATPRLPGFVTFCGRPLRVFPAWPGIFFCIGCCLFLIHSSESSIHRWLVTGVLRVRWFCGAPVGLLAPHEKLEGCFCMTLVVSNGFFKSSSLVLLGCRVRLAVGAFCTRGCVTVARESIRAASPVWGVSVAAGFFAICFFTGG